MSRYNPPPPRDRSPSRFSDRRLSLNHGGSSGPRSLNDPNPNSIDREPPRGPKAQFDSSSRGRGGGFPRGSFGGRPDYRDRDRERDLRDLRPVPNSLRRDDERPDWSRRDRDFTSVDRGGFAGRGNRSYVGRDRSASPSRARRGSSEALSLQSVRAENAAPLYGPSNRGGYAGRGGRGEWDRNRGRGSFIGDRDRDGLMPRSRSREDWSGRERGREMELDRKERMDRREPDQSRERDLKPRDHDLWQRDRSTGRNSSGSAAGPLSQVTNTNAGDPSFQRAMFDPSRRRSTALTPTNLGRDWKRESELEYFGKSEQIRDPAITRRLSPPPAPLAAAASALDYGSPPIAKVLEITADNLPPARSLVSKPEQAATSAAPFLPPTGPKAERAIPAQSSQTQASKPFLIEQHAKPESQPRALRPAPITPVAIPRLAEQARSQEQSRDVMDIDRPPHANVPSGPRASFVGNKPRIMSQQSSGLPNPPNGSNSTSKPSQVDFRTPIPTGPRSQRDGLKTHPGPSWTNPNSTWTSPEYKPRPSIMNNLQSKPYQLEAREMQSHNGNLLRSGPGPFTHMPKPRIYQPPINPRRDPHEFSRREEDLYARVLITDSDGVTLKQDDDTVSAMDVDVSLNPSSEDEAGDDDGLDDEDFAESEEKFRKEMKILEAKKPPEDPNDDPVFVDLLVKICLLEAIVSGDNLDDWIKGLRVSEDSSDSPEDEAAPAQSGLLSPQQEPDEKRDADKPPQPRYVGRPLSKALVNPIPTPPLEDLPFLLKNGSHRFQTFEESDDEIKYEANTTLMRQDFEKAAWEWHYELDEVRSFMRQNYPGWKRSVSDLERSDLKAKQPSPRPATPVPPVVAVVLPPSTNERPSRSRNVTELDYENILRISEQTAREEEEKRERQAASGARPNYDFEALIPEMLNSSEAELSTFLDTNWKIPPGIALEVFRYVPPEDDFDEEEQASFISAFTKVPKKWGKIAEFLPRRSYKDCIMHYYLSKSEENYKEKLRQALPKRKRGRAARNPRLMDNLALGGYGNGGVVAVTDSGRPRRAAAPTFGDVGTDSEAMTPGPGGGKARGGNIREGMEQAVEKAATRGRKAGTVPKPRKTKKAHQEQPLAQMPSIATAETSPQKIERLVARPEEMQPARMKNMHSLPDPTQPLQLQNSIEHEMMDASVPYDLETSSRAGQFSNPPAVGLQITSYWSVPEQQKFPTLIKYFGRNYAAIAEFMKTKSVTMIKNYYTRQLIEGKKELELVALDAEERKMRGEPPGPPPTPVAPPKRRYEATPLMVSLPRPITSNSDVPPLESAMNGVVGAGSSRIDDFSPDILQRGVRGELIAKNRTSREFGGQTVTAPAPQQRVDDGPQSIRAQTVQQRQAPGPRSGFFPEERTELRSVSQQLQGTLNEQVSLLHPSVRGSEGQQQYERLQQRQGFQSQHQELQSRPQHLQQPPPPQSELGRLPLFQTEAATQIQDREGLEHVRRDSSGMSGPQTGERWDRPKDQSPFRRREPLHRGLQYSQVHAQLPPTESRSDVPRPASTPLVAQSETPRPLPAKRSNIMNILNDEVAEPAPPKRSSLEGFRIQNAQSPIISSVGPPEGLFPQQGRKAAATEEVASGRYGARSQYNPPSSQMMPRGTQAPLSEFTPGFAQSPAQQSWLSRFDPRPPSGMGEQGGLQTQATPSPFPTANLQPGSLSSAHRSHIDLASRHESSHRHSVLGQIQHRGHAPSPPPLQSRGGPGGPYRSSSGSSQHNRVTSLGYPQSQAPVAGHPTSAGTTPVSGLHQAHPTLAEYDEQYRAFQQRDQSIREQEAINAQQQRDFERRQHYLQHRQPGMPQTPQETADEERHRRSVAQYISSNPHRTFTPPNGQYSTQPPPHPSHYRQFSQGGAGEERR